MLTSVVFISRNPRQTLPSFPALRSAICHLVSPSTSLFPCCCALFLHSPFFPQNVPFRISRLRTLLRGLSDQLASFQFVPHSLQKTRGCGVPPGVPPSIQLPAANRRYPHLRPPTSGSAP